MQVIGDLLDTINTLLPRPVFIGLLVLLVVVSFPAWLGSVRARQIRGRLRTLARTSDPGRRGALADQVFRIAGSRQRHLVLVAEESLRLGLRTVHTVALEALDASGHAAAAKSIRERLAPERPDYRHPLEATVVARRLAAQGLRDEARRRLQEAADAHPGDPDLMSALAELDSGSVEPHTAEPGR